jgi:hypothetical protein
MYSSSNILPCAFKEMDNGDLDNEDDLHCFSKFKVFRPTNTNEMLTKIPTFMLSSIMQQKKLHKQASNQHAITYRFSTSAHFFSKY